MFQHGRGPGARTRLLLHMFVLSLVPLTVSCSFWVRFDEMDTAEIMCGEAEALQRRSEGFEDWNASAPKLQQGFVAPPPGDFTLSGDRVLDIHGAAALKRGREEMWLDALRGLGFVRGYTAHWERGSEGLTLEIFEFKTHEAALRLQRWTNGLNCPYANEAFTAPGVDGSVGFQVRWSGGFTNDQVSFVRGNRRFVLTAGNGTDRPPERAILFDAVAQVARVARDP